MNSDDDDYYENDIDGDDFDDNESYDQSEAEIDEGYLDDSPTVKLNSSNDSQIDEETFSYKCVTTDEVVLLMNECISEVNEILNIPPTCLRTLLAHYNWDKEMLLEKYYLFEGNQERIFKEAHIINPFERQTAKHKSTDRASRSKKEEACEICCSAFPLSYMTGLACGHSFCKGCWNQYLSVKIMDEGMSQTISCPEYDCDIIVDDDVVMSLLSDARVRKKYQHLMTNSFVSCNALLKWCPAPDCHHVIKVEYRAMHPVTCDCGRVFCFECSELWHDPVSCMHLRKWLKKCDDDSETSNWISANTKECPKCQITIEKDGGCNHMICRNQSCKHEFCWVCLGPWDPHGASWYNCNRYNAAEAKKARDLQEVSRQMLQRYLFYCNRYMNHLQSLRFENKLYARVKRKMEEMQQLNMSWIEVQFLKKAVDILCQCRQTLMYTYVFAFYLHRNNQSIIFEDNQADLERATEFLSEYLERDITSASVSEIKQTVQDKYRYCDSRRRVLLEHVHEGYDKEWWDYIEAL